MKATSLTSVVPKSFFVPLNQYGCPKIDPKFLEQGLLKGLRPG